LIFFVFFLVIFFFFFFFFFFLVDPWKRSCRPSVSTYVWCEYASDCKDFRSASTSESSGDGAEIISGVILSIVSTIQVLQQYTSEAETRTQDQVQRSNAQTVTLKTKQCRLNL